MYWIEIGFKLYLGSAHSSLFTLHCTGMVASKWQCFESAHCTGQGGCIEMDTPPSLYLSCFLSAKSQITPSTLFCLTFHNGRPCTGHILHPTHQERTRTQKLMSPEKFQLFWLWNRDSLKSFLTFKPSISNLVKSKLMWRTFYSCSILQGGMSCGEWRW